MFPDKKSSLSACTSRFRHATAPGEQLYSWTADPEFFEQQCALLERNEQAARRRAHENEYWRQRTLARRLQSHAKAVSCPELAALAAGDAPLKATDAKHLIGEMLDVFMDEFNQLKPASLFFDWVSSMTPTEQTRIIQKAMSDGGYASTVKPEWLRTFNRGIRHMNAGERSSYQIQIRNGLLFQNGVEFDTGKMKTQFSGSGVAIFMQSVDGTFYSSSHLGGRLVSSSSQSGDVCRSAGEWKVECGIIRWVSGKSAFYKPTMEQLANAHQRPQDSTRIESILSAKD